MSFSEIKLFQVKPDKLAEFEKLIAVIADEQKLKKGCRYIQYVKRFYTVDGLIGKTPRELTKIVKCVKYFSYWEFDNKENYGEANGWFFEKFSKEVIRLLIMPFDINLGETI